MKYEVTTMAKRHDANDSKRKNPFLPDPDEYYFDDDLDTVTRNLPTEEDYLPVEEAAAPVDEPLTEGPNRIGIRMVGMKPTAEDMPEDDFTPAYDVDEDDDLTLPRRPERNNPVAEHFQEEYDPESAPVMRTKTKKQQRVLQAEAEQKPKSKTLRIVVSAVITLVLLLIIGMMMLSRTMMPDTAFLKAPETAVSTTMGPLQSFFSGIVDGFADYFRRVKLRDNLEQAYVDLLAENEELYILAAQAQELANELATFKDIDDEMQQNLGLNPLRCRVIGREQGNYFSPSPSTAAPVTASSPTWL